VCDEGGLLQLLPPLLTQHHVTLPEGGEGVVCDVGGLLQLLPPLLTQHYVTVQQTALPASLEYHPPPRQKA
jgi:hypothetical protein